jgi:putative tryptophan/tyrosine transport system substrate-binding protein
MKIRGWIISLLIVSALAFPRAAAAEKVYRVSALVAEDQFVTAFEGFKKKMAETGYVEDKNIRYDFNNAKGDVEVLAKLAQKIVREGPDLIVTSSTTATVQVAKLTEGSHLPVVFLSAGNPLKLVKSYASSGNNLTGISSSVMELTEKRLELFKELAPQIKRIIFLVNPRATNYEEYMNATREAAKRMGFVLAQIEVQATNAEEVKKHGPLITRKLGEGLFIPPDAAMVGATELIAQRAMKEKLSTVGPTVQTVRRGLLAAYSSDYYSLGQQGAKLVDKILRGAKPADLPIEQPYKLQLVINLKTAKALGLRPSREILLRADELIE